MSFKGFSIFSSDGHFVQRSATILAILVKELQGNICVKLFWNWSSSLGGDVLWMNCWRHTTDDGRLTTDAGHRVITIAHLEHLVLRWAKNVGRVPIVNLCMSSGHALYFYQVLWNYLKRYQRADTISILKITKGTNSAKNVGGVTVVNLCTSSGHALYLCHVSWHYLERYQSYGVDRNDEPLTDGWTEGQMDWWTDTQNFRGYNIIPHHFCVAGHKNYKAVVLSVCFVW